MTSSAGGLHELALFAGAGGGILGGLLLGWRTVCAVELDPYCRSVLLARQRDGMLGRFPIWDDVCTFDGKPWRGHVDVISGGFPCQDISVAGKQAGIEGARSGLWKEMARIVGEIRPRYVLVENSPNLVRRGLALVLGGLAALGYDARWGVLGAVDAGAPHKRERIWIVANASGRRCGCPDEREMELAGRAGVVSTSAVPDAQRRELRDEPGGRGGAYGSGASVTPDDGGEEFVADTTGQRLQGGAWEGLPFARRTPVEPAGGRWWLSEPALGRVAHGVAHRVDRLRVIGNGQVPAVVRLAWDLWPSATVLVGVLYAAT